MICLEKINNRPLAVSTSVYCLNNSVCPVCHNKRSFTAVDVFKSIQTVPFFTPESIRGIFTDKIV